MRQTTSNILDVAHPTCIVVVECLPHQGKHASSLCQVAISQSTSQSVRYDHLLISNQPLPLLCSNTSVGIYNL